MASTPDPSSYEYDVALSFASEQRWYVEAVAQTLGDWGVSVFYDRHETAELWGQDGIERFSEIYGKTAFRVVMFISEPYVTKAWTSIERRATLGRLLSDPNGNHILPVRFDDVDVPGLPPQQMFVRADDVSPIKLAELIVTSLVSAGRLPATVTDMLGAQKQRAQLVGFSSLVLDDAGKSRVEYRIHNGTDSAIESVVVAVADPGQDGDPDMQSGCAIEVVHPTIAAGETVEASESVTFSQEPAFVELPYLGHLLWTDADGSHWSASGTDVHRRLWRARTC
jgi:hypothetical protein